MGEVIRVNFGNKKQETLETDNSKENPGQTLSRLMANCVKAKETVRETENELEMIKELQARFNQAVEKSDQAEIARIMVEIERVKDIVDRRSASFQN